MPHKTVSIIIVSYHTGAALWLCIHSALMQTQSREVIVVNNGNDTGVVLQLETLAREDSRIKLISGHGNVGFGTACNLGVAAASGDYVLLLNPDCRLPANALTMMLSEIQHYPDNTLAGCYLQNPDGSEQRGGRRSLLTPENAIAETFKMERLLKKSGRLNLNTSPMPAVTHEVPVISGAFMFLSRNFYHQLGGFDEGYFLHMEDTDFCYRVHVAKGKVICVPSVKVLHFRSTSEASNAFIEKHKAKGFVRYLDKYFAGKHSAFSLRLLTWGIYIRYIVKVVIGRLDRVFVPSLVAKQEVARLILLYSLTNAERCTRTLEQKLYIVTGSSTEVGLTIIGNLLAQGARVIAICRTTSTVFQHENLVWVPCDLTSADVIPLLQGVKADAVINTTCIKNIEPLLPLFKESGITRLISVTSINEDNAENERFIALCEAADIHTTFLGTALVYGGGFNNSVSVIAESIKRFGKMLRHKKGTGLRNPVSCYNVANAVIAVLEKRNTYAKIYSLGGKDTLTYTEMVDKIANYTGKPYRFVQFPALPLVASILTQLYQTSHFSYETVLRMNQDNLADNQAAINDFNYIPDAFMQTDTLLIV